MTATPQLRPRRVPVLAQRSVPLLLSLRASGQGPAVQTSTPGLSRKTFRLDTRHRISHCCPRAKFLVSKLRKTQTSQRTPIPQEEIQPRRDTSCQFPNPWGAGVQDREAAALRLGGRQRAASAQGCPRIPNAPTRVGAQCARRELMALMPGWPPCRGPLPRTAQGTGPPVQAGCSLTLPGRTPGAGCRRRSGTWRGCGAG